MSFLGNAWNDAKGVVDPRNYIKAGSQLIHHPIRFGKAVGKQYVDLAEHPIRSFENHPLNTLLELAPLAKVADFGSLGSTIARSSERGAAKEALIKAATKDTNIHTNFGTKPSAMLAHLNKVTGTPTAFAIRKGLDEPTQWGATDDLLRKADGAARQTTDVLQQSRNTRAGHFLSQPAYRPKPAVNEGPAGLSDMLSKRRELFDFQTEGKNAGDLAQIKAGGLNSYPLEKLMMEMEDAHAAGNVDVGDAIANHIKQKYGFDPYTEDPPMHNPSFPPDNAPKWMAPYSQPNLKRRFPHSNN